MVNPGVEIEEFECGPAIMRRIFGSIQVFSLADPHEALPHPVLPSLDFDPTLAATRGSSMSDNFPCLAAVSPCSPELLGVPGVPMPPWLSRGSVSVGHVLSSPVFAGLPVGQV